VNVEILRFALGAATGAMLVSTLVILYCWARWQRAYKAGSRAGTAYYARRAAGAVTVLWASVLLVTVLGLAEVAA